MPGACHVTKHRSSPPSYLPILPEWQGVGVEVGWEGWVGVEKALGEQAACEERDAERAAGGGVRRGVQAPAKAAVQKGDRGTLPIRNRLPPGPYSGLMPMVLRRSQEGGRFLMSEVPLYEVALGRT